MSEIILVVPSSPTSVVDLIPEYDVVPLTSLDVNLPSPAVSLTKEFDEITFTKEFDEFIVMEVLERVKREINHVLCPKHFLSDWHVKRAKLQVTADKVYKRRHSSRTYANKQKKHSLGGNYEKKGPFLTPKTKARNWLMCENRRIPTSVK